MSGMKDYVKFLSSLVLFGSNGVMAAHIALPSQDIVVLRTLIAACMLLAVFKLAGRRFACRGRDFLFVVASGVAVGASWLFLYEAYRLVGVGVSSLAYYCAPIMVMALTPVLFKERIGAGAVASLFVVLTGALLLNAHTLEAGGSAWGMACGWASAVAHAAMVIFSKKADRVDGLESSAIQMAAAFAVALAFLAATGGLPFAVPAEAWPWVWVLGLVNTGAGCYLYFSSFAGLAAQTVAVLGYVEPLSAVVCGLVFLGEPMTVLQAAGGALIVGGAAAGTLATRRVNDPDSGGDP